MHRWPEVVCLKAGFGSTTGHGCVEAIINRKQDGMAFVSVDAKDITRLHQTEGGK